MSLGGNGSRFVAATLVTALVAAVLAAGPVKQAAAQPNNDPAFANLEYSFTIDSNQGDSSTVTQVATVAATDADTGDTLTYSLVASETSTTLYLANDSLSPAHNTLYKVDSSTGAATKFGPDNYGFADTGASNWFPYGIAEFHGKYYLLNDSGADVHLLNLGDDTVSAVGEANVNTGKEGGLAFADDTLYMLHQYESPVSTNLFSVNRTSGRATNVNTSKTNLGLASSVEVDTMAYHQGKMYFHDSSGCLRTVNLSTAQASSTIGTCGLPGISGEDSPTAMTSHDGTMYLAGNDTNRLYTLNTTNNNISTVNTATTRLNSNVNKPVGLAPGYTRPSGFGVNASTGAITYTGSGPAEGKYTLYLQVRDSKDRFGDADTAVDDAAIINITVENSAPEFSDSTYTFSFDAGSDGSDTPIAVGTASATDANSDTLTYSLQTTAANYTINSSTGAITYTGSNAPAGEYTLTARVTDNKNSTGGTDATIDDTAAVNVTVENPVPAFGASKYSFSINTGSDGSSTPTPVGTVSATDANNDTLTYSLAPSETDRLYALRSQFGTANDILYSISNQTSDSITRVGNANHFGLSDTNVSLATLTWHRHQLYSVDNGSGGLYRMNTLDGTAARVGTVDGFGVEETSPTGIASHNGVLYMIGSQTRKLYTLNPETAIATAVSSSVTNFGTNISDRRTGLASHGGVLYTVRYDPNHADSYLESLNTSTGVATRVGASAGFGIGVIQASDLVSDGSNLYLTEAAQDNDSPVRVNTTTGAGTFVSSFGIPSFTAGLARGYRKPPDFAIVASTGAVTYTGSGALDGIYALYAQVTDGKNLTGGSDNAIDATASIEITVTSNKPPAFSASSYSFSISIGADGSSAAVGVGTPSATDSDADDTITYSLYASDASNKMYAVQDAVGSGSDALFSIDSSTGSATRIGTAHNFGQDSSVGPSALAWHNGKLYMTGTDSAKLYTVNPVDGTALAVGTAANFGVSETEPAGLAVHQGELYMIGNSNDRLYRVDTATGTASAVSTGVTNFGHRVQSKRIGLASHGGKLYTLNASGDYLESVDAATGASQGVGSVAQFGVSESSPAGIVAHASSLYMTGTATDKLYTLNTATGAATSVGALGNTLPDPSALASGYVQPAGYALNTATGAITYTGTSAPGGEFTLYAQVSDGKNKEFGADTAIDDAAMVTVTASNRAPEFASDSQDFTLAAGANGTRRPVTLGTASASDADGDTVTYSLRPDDSAAVMYLVGAEGDALYSLDSISGVEPRRHRAPSVRGAHSQHHRQRRRRRDPLGIRLKARRQRIPRELDPDRLQRVQHAQLHGQQPHQLHRLHLQGARRERRRQQLRQQRGERHPDHDRARSRHQPHRHRRRSVRHLDGEHHLQRRTVRHTLGIRPKERRQLLRHLDPDRL